MSLISELWTAPAPFLPSQFSSFKNSWGHVPLSPPPQSEAKLGAAGAGGRRNYCSPQAQSSKDGAFSTCFKILCWLEICYVYNEKILDKAMRNISLEHNQGGQSVEAFLYVHSLAHPQCRSLVPGHPLAAQLPPTVI